MISFFHFFSRILLAATVVLVFLAPSAAPDGTPFGAGRAYAQQEALDYIFVGVTPPSQQSVPVPEALPKSKSFFESAFEKIGNVIIDGALSLLEWIARIFFNACGWFMMAMGAIFDFSLGRSMNSELINNLGVINAGWTITRDVANMFFIFILLYIAIQTILGLMGHQTKVLLRNIIVVALLINFSLFITKVVIDASNVFALAFLFRIETQQQDASGNTVISHSPVVALQSGLKLQTLFMTNRNIADPSQSGARPGENIMVYLGGGILMLVTGYVFLVGAMLFLVRLIAFIFCMIFAPFAFLGFVLPQMHQITSKWWNTLLSNALLAPVFCFMIYFVVLLIRSQDLFDVSLASNASYAQAFVGTGANWMILYNFFFLIALMVGTLAVSKAVAGGTANLAINMARGGMRHGMGRAIGGSAYLMRRGVGWASDKIQRSEGVQKLANKKGLAGTVGRTLASAAHVGATASFDPRAIPGMGMFGAAGGKGGFRAARQERDREVIKRAEELFPNNPAAQEEYIRQHTKQFGVVGPSRLDQKPGKYTAKEDKVLADRKDALANERAKEENKQNLEKSVGAIEELNKKKLELEQKGQQASADYLKTVKEIDDASRAMAQAMKRMTGEDVAKLMNKKEYRDNKEFRENLSAKDYSAINKMYLEGKYKEAMGNEDKAMMETLTLGALKSDEVPEATKRMIKNQIKNGTWGHEVDFKKELEERLRQNASDDELNDTWRMLDNEDKADLRELLVHERIAERLNGATLGAINKKGNEGFYDDVPEFTQKLKEYHERGVLGRKATRNNVNTAAGYINKNTGKQDNFFHQFPKTAQGQAAAQGWNIPASRMNEVETKVRRHYDLGQKLSSLSLTPAEESEYRALNAEIGGLSGDEARFAAEIKSKLP